MNSHTWLSAVLPTTRAGPRLRAGFTEVPVIGMPRRWTTVRVSPMAIAAVAALAVAEVTLRTMKTKMAVRTVSKMSAPPIDAVGMVFGLCPPLSSADLGPPRLGARGRHGHESKESCFAVLLCSRALLEAA